MVKKDTNIINLFKKYITNFYVLTALIFLITVLIICYNIPESFYLPKKYYRCDTKKIGQITGEIFQNNNIKKDNNDWDIYVPCGYNHVEKELLTIKVNNNKNKFIFGINGCDSIVSKNKIWESLVECFGRHEASNYMPESYVLHRSNDMKIFREHFDSKNIYILKKNVQRKEGLKLTNNLDVILKSVLDNYRVVQKYKTDLYLINQRKVNLRIYLLIVIKNGILKFYVSNLGKCIYTRKKYNHNNYDFESNITSYNLDMNVYNKNPRTFKELFSYIDNNSNANNNSYILSNNIHKLMHKISQCLANNIFQSSNIKMTTSFQIFGADVIFDNNFHPYLLELNKGPDMIPRDEEDKLMKKRVQEDMFKIVGIIPNYTTNNVFFEIFSKKL